MTPSLPRLISFPILGFILSACSIQGLADKILPDDVVRESSQLVDALMEQDVTFFLDWKADLLPPEQLAVVTDEVFEASLRQAFLSGQNRAEVSRHIVGVKAIASGSLRGRKANTYETVYEVKTDEGLTLISTRLAYRAGTNECCEIKLIEALDFETSPYREGQALRRKIMKAVGVLLIGGLGVLGFMFVRRRRRRRLRAEP